MRILGKVVEVVWCSGQSRAERVDLLTLVNLVKVDIRLREYAFARIARRVWRLQVTSAVITVDKVDVNGLERSFTVVFRVFFEVAYGRLVFRAADFK